MNERLKTFSVIKNVFGHDNRLHGILFFEIGKLSAIFF